MSEEHIQNLIEASDKDDLDDESESENLNETPPPSTRAKKVLIWNPENKVFEIDEKDLAELRDGYFKEDKSMREFEKMY
jgi:hypothetical protein